MFVHWIKWKIYIRWKNEWKKLTPTYMFIFLVDILKMTVFFSLSLFILDTLFDPPEEASKLLNDYAGGLAKELLQQALHLEADTKLVFIWTLLFIQLTIMSIISGVEASKWELSYKDDLILHNLPCSERQKKLLLYSEQIVWQFKQLITGFMPILLALLFLVSSSFSHFFVLLFIILLVYFIQSQFVSNLHNFTTFLKMRKREYAKFIIFQSFVFKLSLAGLGYLFGTTFIPWINDFPLLGKQVDVHAFQNWQLDGQQLFLQQVSAFVQFFLHGYWPHALLARTAVDSAHLIECIFYIFIVTILTLLLAMCNAKTNKDRQMKDNPVFEKFFLAIGKYLEISNSLIATRIKLMCRSQQFLQRPAVLLGGAITWSVVGGCAALLSHTDSVKVFYLVLTLCIYMLTYFLSTLLFDDLSSQFSFDSDGRQLSLFIFAGFTLWHVFTQKIRMFLIASVPMFILTQLVIVSSLTLVSWKIIILILIVTIINYVAFAFVNYIPSLTRPHFDFMHVEQLDDYADKGMIKAILRTTLLGFLIPIMLLPLAFYLANYVEEEAFVFLQLICVPILTIAGVWLGAWLIKRKNNRLFTIEELNL